MVRKATNRRPLQTQMAPMRKTRLKRRMTSLKKRMVSNSLPKSLSRPTQRRLLLLRTLNKKIKKNKLRN